MDIRQLRDHLISKETIVAKMESDWALSENSKNILIAEIRNENENLKNEKIKFFENLNKLATERETYRAAYETTQADCNEQIIHLK